MHSGKQTSQTHSNLPSLLLSGSSHSLMFQLKVFLVTIIFHNEELKFTIKLIHGLIRPWSRRISFKTTKSPKSNKFPFLPHFIKCLQSHLQGGNPQYGLQGDAMNELVLQLMATWEFPSPTKEQALSDLTKCTSLFQPSDVRFSMINYMYKFNQPYIASC